MTGTRTPARPAVARSAAPPARGGLVSGWTRDLGMGVKFAFTGGRESWVRTLLTAIGVGLGAAMLLLTTSVPEALAERTARGDARLDTSYSGKPLAKADNTLLTAPADTSFRDRDVRGRLLKAEGPRAPLPPGLGAFPAVGEMHVSPALRELLASPDGKLLKDRLPYRISGTVADEGLIGPAELLYYAGSGELDGLTADESLATRIDSFGAKTLKEPLDPILMLLVVIILVVLLMPVMVFIATAVRFGGERRDRRLAALRLVGSDARMTRRIAAGETVAGALLGLLFGVGMFLAGRQLAERVTVERISVFPEDLSPTPALVALVLVSVPVAAVAVTLFALRGVVIEPLGVVRTSAPKPRKLWWRLLVPFLGLLMLVPMFGQGSEGGFFNTYLVVGGTVLLLVGITALLPWAVEALVGRLGAGPVAWQLAVRRLQLSSGNAARMVNGIAVAVAGAVALQMLFAGIEDDYTIPGQGPVRAQMDVYLPESVSVSDAERKLSGTTGVERTVAMAMGWAGGHRKDSDSSVPITVGGCEVLREVAKLPSCRDGDTFLIDSATDSGKRAKKLADRGGTLYLDPSSEMFKGAEAPWRLPGRLTRAEPAPDPTGYSRDGFLVTPGAFPDDTAGALHPRVFIQIDEDQPDAYEYARTATAQLSPFASPSTYNAPQRAEPFENIRTGLSIGASCVLMLIGASLLISQIEQLRERKKLLSVLVAFGTRRRTLAWSVMWQAAVPIALGLVLAVIVGLGLGAVLLTMTRESIRVDWDSLWAMTGIAAGVVFLVTALSMPALFRLMRPEGLRTE
ncbi:ABC transporter permease [Streptomyces uncialis]|uniref:ABC transporter permease n=1 Tax=Streptomyces uncialis TaxID=1048205 RepID=UPI0038658A34